jgi:hypothetical protein
MTDPIPHDSFFGGFNLLRRRYGKRKRFNWERPYYPVINPYPNAFEILENMNNADLGVFVFYWGAGIVYYRFQRFRHILRKNVSEKNPK